MASRVVDVPSALSSKKVSTKLPLFQRRFGVRYEYNLRHRQVTFSGEVQSCVDEACDELRDLFTRMELSKRTVCRINSSSRARCDYVYAVSEAVDHAWQFVRTPTPVSDVNTKCYPYELVQHHQVARSPALDSGVNQDQGSRFLVDFSDACVASSVELVKALMSNLGEKSVGVKAVFGRKLFKTLGGLCAQTGYSPQVIQATHLSRKLQSNWSNVCNTENQHMHALIADLRAAAQRLEVNEPSERVSVYLKHSGSHRHVIAKFAREYTGNWTLARCEVKVGNRFVLDTMLSNGVSFRVRVLCKEDPDDELLEQVKCLVTVGEPKDACDVFATRVHLANSSSGGDEDGGGGEWEIDWMSIRTELDVPFEGLVFKLIGLKDEVQLEVELPKKEEEEAIGAAGYRFEQLLTKLQAVLSKY
ncbi:hypothetical protein Gpo141_00004592 [Globisporangium polare]